MGKNEGYEALFSLLDEAERLITRDFLSEEKERVSYVVLDKKEKERGVLSLKERIRACSLCALSHRGYKYIEEGKVDSKVLFIVSGPSGFSLFEGEEKRFFDAWVKVLELESIDYKLSSLIRCPSDSLDDDIVNLCKRYLIEEMTKERHSLYVLLGEDAARYITHSKEGFDQMRRMEFLVNNTPTRVTFHPRDIVSDYNRVRKEVYRDLLEIKRNLEKIN